jgi:hypothetical protein
MAEAVVVLKFVMIGLKVLSVVSALALFLIAAGWLRGADNLAFPGLGLIVASPLLILLLAVLEVILVAIFGFLSALTK